MTNLEKRGTFRLKQNIEYVLRYKNGNAKPLWNENAVARFLREELGISMPRIPLLFGFWGLTLNIHNLVVNAGMAGVASRVTTDVTNDTAQLVLTFNFTASFAVTESGVLNAASVGVLLARQTFSAINVANGDSLQVTWKFDID